MDVLNLKEELTLSDVELRHKIIVPGHKWCNTYVYIFIDKQANTYSWVTINKSVCNALKEGGIYDIFCKCDRSTNRIDALEIINKTLEKTVQSEQPATKPDAEDVLLGLKDY